MNTPHKRGVGIGDVIDAAVEMAARTRRNVLVVWTVACALETMTLVWLALELGPSVAKIFLEPTPFSEFKLLAVSPAVVFLAVLSIVALGAFRTALWSPMRRIVVEDEQMSVAQTYRMARSKTLIVYAASQVVGTFEAVVTAVVFLTGAAVAFIPQLLAAVALKSVGYAVAGRDEGLYRALRTGFRWSRRNWYLLFGIEGGLVVLAAFLGSFIPQWVAAAPEKPTFAIAIGATYMLYHFARFGAMSATFLAIDRAESAD